MNPELESQAEYLWGRAEKAYKFNGRFNIFPYQEGSRLVNDFKNLSESISAVPQPNRTEDVHQNELKRRLSGEAVYLEHALSGHYYTFEDVLNLYGIDETDTSELRGWLQANRDNALETIDRVYAKTEVRDYRFSVPTDIPTFRRQSEEFAATHIGNFHKKLSKIFEERTHVGTFLRDITSVPTAEGRSYFDTFTNVLALGIPAICYITEDQTLHINERELIRLFGHEGMGHGLNKVVTDASNLPSFMKRNSESTRATVESVGQFYERVIFEDLASSPETQEELGIAHKFGELYQDEKDTQLINLYQRRLFHYGITVLADKELGDMGNPEMRRAVMQRKIELLSEVSLFPGFAVGFVENTQHNFDSQGNLSFGLAREMVYSAQPAQKVLEVMVEKGVEYDLTGRGKIDMLLLSGFWTPIGLVENAKSASLA